MFRLLRILSLSGMFGMLFAGLPAHATLLGPTPYLQASDSPWASTSFSYFHLEDFEDGLLNTPGVSVNSGAAVSLPNPNNVSVDADDGSIDGSGTAGHSMAHGSGFTGITFTFDELALGALPTHAGLVWTDGVNDVIFEVFDGIGTLIGTSGPQTIAQSGFNGGTAEDSFFGFEHSGGIGSISIRHTHSFFGIEVDHLQYGLAASVPEPGALAVFSLGLIGFVIIRRRRAIR
ncbi:MAG: hypothetical protein CMM52_10605 [Rhodospirillaceae bacterium]|nr:hypothetical protein [Rhodospirillaceae bacterium]